jgi:hypothetical protein
MRDTVRVEEAFGYVIFGVVIVSALVAVLTLAGARKSYDQIGRGGLSINEDGIPRAGGGGAPPPVSREERDEEIRQLLRARNARHSATGTGGIVDVEAELARLTTPAIDAALREEIRELVVARNNRRVARGKEPLDVEAEVERQVRELGG